MKWTLLASILGLALGFVFGRGSHQDVERVDGESVVPSTRRISREVIDGDDERRGGRRWKVVEDLSRKLAIRVSLDQVERGRLAKWILELELEDFPGVLEVLKGLGESSDVDPFESRMKNADFLLMGLARWYQLEGVAVLKWVLTEPAVLRNENQRVVFGNLIRDGYARDPGLSFQLLKKYANVLAKKDGRRRGLGVSWRYQLGKWSQNLGGELAEWKKLEDEFGIALDETAHSGDGVVHPEISLLRGLVDGKRTEVAREFFEEQWPGKFARYERILARMDEDEIARRGWRDLKSAIEKGDIEKSEHRAKQVFEGWVGEDSEGAISWFLGLRFEDLERSEQIREVAFSGAFVTKGRWIGRNRLDYDGMLEFLDQKGVEGEPVHESYAAMVSATADVSDWDVMEKLESRVTQDVWERGMSQVKKEAVDVTTFRMGGEKLVFVDFDEGGRELVRRFGVEGEVLDSMAEANGESLRKLMTQLEVVGE